jgi:hypothetical protein
LPAEHNLKFLLFSSFSILSFALWRFRWYFWLWCCESRFGFWVLVASALGRMCEELSIHHYNAAMNRKLFRSEDLHEILGQEARKDHSHAWMLK